MMYSLISYVLLDRCIESLDSYIRASMSQPTRIQIILLELKIDLAWHKRNNKLNTK